MQSSIDKGSIYRKHRGYSMGLLREMCYERLLVLTKFKVLRS